MFCLLENFKNENRHGLGPLNVNENIFLSRWFQEQRLQINLISFVKKARLEKIGFY